MKSDWSLTNLKKKQKKYAKLSENKSSQQNSDFLYSKIPYDTRTSLFIAFGPLGTQKGLIVWRKI